ncbi:cap-specific mRNA (nucleoside-2'-O-)-methyltransferase 2-like isoform X2 [Oscarella lobularis]|uniref:cap-specific mRNA (nucleoside-2'-O-)-methyltransferase 2-like isoform X2 n=1 Tax=Oscarella lobularis TaxID=121494 RepID=UPI003313F977
MSKKRQRYSKGVAKDVEMLFSKVFPLDASERDETPFRLPDSDRMFIEIKSSILPEMSELKERLNDIKSKLNDKEPFKWRQHTKNLNRAGKIVKALKDSIKPELCTQAWAKFHEIVTSFPLISTRSGSLKTVHLCEAPGAFITSLNHYIKSHCSSEIREWKWRATTLNPYCESHSLNSMIPTNEFITRTYENWYFGVDNTGDLMKWENVSELTTGHDVINLVTADGSVDCLDVPGEQESHVAALHYCELVAGLAILADGGSFVLKMFTLFEHSSVCMMYLLVCCFSKVWVSKPATSKSGNSEVYVICVGYRGKSVLTDKHFDRLKSTYGENPFEKALFPLECIPRSFLSQMINCSAFFSQHQIEAIETNLAAFPRMTSSQWHRLNEAKNKAVSIYMNRCQIKILERKNFVVSDVFLSGSFVFPDYKLAPGSYNERQQKQSWHSKQGIDKTTRRNKQRVPVPWSLADLLARKLVERVLWLKNSAGSFSVGVSKAIEGSRIKKIQNSLFCCNRLLQESEEALSNATIVQSEYSDSDTSFPYFAFKNSKSKSGLSYEVVDWAAIDSACNLLSGGPLAYTSLYSKERSQFVEWKTGSSAKHVDYETGLRVNLAMGDVYLGSEVGTNSMLGDEELKGQDTFLSQVLLALKILHPDGSFVVRVADLLTRFSASLVFILYKTFEMVDVIKPTSSCPFTSDRYIVCKGFRRCDASVLEMLEGVCQKMTELSLTDRAIVEILPTPYLLQDEIFCSWLCDRNDDVENRRISAIIEMEKRFWASSSEDLP